MKSDGKPKKKSGGMKRKFKNENKFLTKKFDLRKTLEPNFSSAKIRYPQHSSVRAKKNGKADKSAPLKKDTVNFEKHFQSSNKISNSALFEDLAQSRKSSNFKKKIRNKKLDKNLMKKFSISPKKFSGKIDHFQTHDSIRNKSYQVANISTNFEEFKKKVKYFFF